jgi:hypothetical protein
MNRFSIAVVALGLGGLGACQDSPEKAEANNIQVNADAVANAVQEAADDATNVNVEEALENVAEQLREDGDTAAGEVTGNAAE